MIWCETNFAFYIETYTGFMNFGNLYSLFRLHFPHLQGVVRIQWYRAHEPDI